MDIRGFEKIVEVTTIKNQKAHSVSNGHGHVEWAHAQFKGTSGNNKDQNVDWAEKKITLSLIHPDNTGNSKKAGAGVHLT